ncbi:Cellobiose dehydrogenase [Apiospora phragmitis]|uniref:Cellobiose dehydrogenase n=1 Tax=Apiospora phragmitis TaxID=2905665 RepID=A0ABR1X7F4_9PEZI
MGHFVRLLSLLAAVGSNVRQAWAQAGTPTHYTDADTGIVFDTWPVSSGMTFGVALPSDALTADADEFIGIFVGSPPPRLRPNPSTCPMLTGLAMLFDWHHRGWLVRRLLGGPMTNSLLLMAWPYETEYTGDAKLTQISSTTGSDGFSVIFRCQNCLSWNQGGSTGSASTSAGVMVLGWASAVSNPTSPECPAKVVMKQHEAQGIFGAQLDSSAANPSYTEWAALATKTWRQPDNDYKFIDRSSHHHYRASYWCTRPTGTTYDYVIVGAGAGGIPLADKLSESGKSVLLIEKGPPSSGRWGGNNKPAWLDGTNLTRYDVPGLCNEIWQDSAGIACTDTDQMAGCVLGGGTAINAGLWWKPHTTDWDYNFPSGWKASDMAGATSRLYLQQGYDVLATGLRKGGWKEVTANAANDQKNHTFGHTAYMYSHGERGGPMATYLESASKRSNFKLWMQTSVKRVVRQGGHVTGLEVEPYLQGGYQGVVNLTPVTGRVILSAGTFGSAKLLMRSGIGPQDQLEVVKASAADGATMLSSDEWINLPVGYNLEDHTNTDLAFDAPNATDKGLYLGGRAGILAQAAPNIGPMMWDEITGADGIVRQLQWTSRVEGSAGVDNGYAMTMSQYLGRGATSRGRMTITSALNTVVSTVPYLRDPEDVAAVIQGIKNVQAAVNAQNIPGLKWMVPAPDQSVEDFVNNMVVATSNRRANHWIGTSKMGTDDGRKNNGTAVVDLNTRVYGTDNLFVVDASIFPGMVTTNPSSYIVIVAEKAAERILALPAVTANARYGQCGGADWTGSYACAQGEHLPVPESVLLAVLVMSLPSTILEWTHVFAGMGLDVE